MNNANTTNSASDLILPPIFKKSKTGAISQWSIAVTGSTFTVTFGQKDGRMQTKWTECSPKNKGRSNATTANEQAILEAAAKHQKQLKVGYSLDPSGISDVMLAMKIKTYATEKKKLTFPIYGTFKKDGINAIWLRDDSRALRLLSRTGKEYPILEHEVKQIHATMDELGTNSLQVELFNRGLFLEEIISAVKKPNKNTHLVQSWLFELPNINIQYSEKIALIESSGMKHTEIVELNSFQEIQDYHALAVEQCFEGLVLIYGDCRYEAGVRTSDSFKLKKALDAEFKILDYKTDKNGHPVFVVDNPKGKTATTKTFKVKPKGSDAERKSIIEEFEEKYRNKWYRIEFERLSMGNVPLKPVGLSLRLCDSQGEPIE